MNQCSLAPSILLMSIATHQTTQSFVRISVSALMLVAWRQERHLVCKKPHCSNPKVLSSIDPAKLLLTAEKRPVKQKLKSSSSK